MQLNTNLIAIYNRHNNIFVELKVPNNVSRETLIDNILMECGEFPIVHSQPDTLRHMIGIWSARNIVIWQKKVETTHYTYNPIDNYDRTETRQLMSNSYDTRGSARETRSTGNQNSENTDGYMENVKAQGDGSGEEDTTRTPNLTEKREYNSAEVYDITEDSVTTHTHRRTAFNTGSLEATEVDNTHNVSKKTGDTKHTGDDTIKNTGNEKTHTEYSNHATTETTTGSDRELKGNIDTKNQSSERAIEDNSNNRYDVETIRARGNVGITMTQTMIQAQRDVIDYNIYDIITQEFKRQFCVMVY